METTQETRENRRIRLLGALAGALRRENVETYSNVVKSFHISFQTAQSTIQNAILEGRVADLQRTGRPLSINQEAIDRMEIWIEEREGLFTRREMIEELGLGVTERTLSAYINRLGFNSYRRLRAMMLTERDMLRRYDFCAFKVHWDYNDWIRTVYSDESSFKKLHSGNNLNVWRRTGDYTHASAFRGQRQQDGGTLTHVFGVISVFGPGLLLFLDGTLDGPSYMRLLQEHVR